ncbi:MAG: hypothetical protein WDZ40_02495 [Candidatus Spechtbacterales bacterium]
MTKRKKEKTETKHHNNHECCDQKEKDVSKNIEDATRDTVEDVIENEKSTSLSTSGNLIVPALIIGVAIITSTFIFKYGPVTTSKTGAVADEVVLVESFRDQVLPEEGIVLPADLGNFGKQMIAAGVIDEDKFQELYQKRGGFDAQMQELIYGDSNDKVVMNEENANFLLNYFWAFGLSNKNEILDNGPMVDERYGGDASKFASTGGWTLAKGDVMDHYSRYDFVKLTKEQQEKVESISKNIYRPCCGNSVYFPDCNHGMAMLGLLEIMASQGVDEAGMYKVALQVNSYWFPDTYLTLAKYFAIRDVEWEKVDAKEVLGSPYSSGAGFRAILEEVEPVKGGGGGGCGV